MTGEFPPGLILVVGGLLVPLLRGYLRAAFMLALPVIAFFYMIGLPYGELGKIQFLQLTLTATRVDSLSLMFGYVFLLATLIGTIYALHLKDTLQHVATLIYAGGSLCAVFAGDLVSFFIWWEVIAVASVFLIWPVRTERAWRAGQRYLIVQMAAGVILLAGVMLHYRATGSIAFDLLGLDTTAKALILFALGVKAAFPLLHNWLEDSYPEATVTGTVLLSSFTTKVAIYALARGYAGTDILVPIGTVMTAFPIFYAVIENDLRRVLSYSMINQLGFMVVGIGIGTNLALNGAVAHAFADIIFKGLLFMSMGAVLFRVGTAKGSELGGLYKSMPWTTSFCMVGAASISALPLFSAFVTKSMIMSEAMDQGHFWVWLILLFASAGVVEHAGIKIPYFAFFAHDSGKRCKEAPLNMLTAMAISAALCIGIGSFPSIFYTLLPYNATYEPYTLNHVVTQTQLLFFAALAVAVLIRTGIYPPELRSVNLDADWFYRRLGYRTLMGLDAVASWAWAQVVDIAGAGARFFNARLHNHHGPDGVFGRWWPTGTMAFWTTVMLGAYLILSYL